MAGLRFQLLPVPRYLLSRCSQLHTETALCSCPGFPLWRFLLSAAHFASACVGRGRAADLSLVCRTMMINELDFRGRA